MPSDTVPSPPSGGTSRLAPRLTLCGSLSLHPVALGAAMHLAGYRALDLPFTYVPFGVTDLEGAMRGMRALAIRGLGVSFPYKQAVMPYLDELSDAATRIGAVNTVVNDGGRLSGHNTDLTGAVRALEEVRSLVGSRVLLVGAGGAARAIAHGVVDAGATLTIANRDVAKAESVASDVVAAMGPDRARAVSLAEVERAADYDVVINATSLGMREVGLGSAVPEVALRAGQVVMDIVYKPLRTELLAAARRRGAVVIDGSRMLLHQAARQFELYTRHPAPLTAMNAALTDQIAALG